MSDARRAEEVFHEVASLSGRKREERLLQLCEEDEALLGEVRSLLQHLDAVGPDFLSNELLLLNERALPERIGPYRIEKLLGEGGMGTVYLAEQAEPLRRRVALKVMAFGTRHSALTRRFLVERRTLARLTHPNVAQVFDAGETEDGSPYFVMEFVEGLSLVDHCDEQRLDLRTRIRLFLAVCSGIEHAHRRGVIHRDLKPSNILVANHAGHAVPKIIDFGIARESDPDERSDDGLTKGPIGTPDYMSPEQMSGDSLVDTRSDVFSLGMILYELLVGAHPLDAAARKKMSLSERLRHGATTDYPRPSERLNRTKERAELARARRATPDSLRRTLRGDLDWIVLRAVERDPERRYQSATDLAADLQRYLDHRPVHARPPDRVYRFRKAVRRNPMAWSIGAAAVLLLLGALTILSFQNRRIVRQQRQVAQEAATAERVVEFLVEMFNQSDPRIQQVKTAREILELGRARVTELDDVPEVRARLLLTMGVVHTEMGLMDDARTLLEESIEVCSKEVHDPARLAAAQDALATLLRQTGEPARAEELERNALATRKRLFGDSHVSTLTAQANLAVILQTLGRFDESDALLRSTLAVWPRPDGQRSRGELGVLHNLAVVALERRSFAEAESMLVEVDSLRTALLGPDHLETLEARSNLAYCYAETGRLERATDLWESVLTAERKELGASHPNALRTASNLASAYSDLGALDRADTLLVDILARSRESLGPSSRGTLAALGNLATLRLKQGRLGEAVELFEEQVVRSEEVLGPGSPGTLRSENNLAVAHRRAGQYDEAESILLEVLTARVEALGPSHPEPLRTTSSLGLVYEKQGRWDEAEARHRVAYEGRRDTLGPSDPSTLGSLHNLIRTLVQLGRRDEALALAQAGAADGLDLQRLLADPLMAEIAERAEWVRLAGP